MRATRRAVLLSCLTLVSVTAVAVPVATPVAVANGSCSQISQITIDSPGPLGPISVFGDSVGMGAAYEPSLPTLLAATGWGPIRFVAGCGFTAGNYQPAGSRFSVANWISWWRAEGWDAPNIAVNLGNNDIGFCGQQGVEECAVGIRYLMDTIGPGHTVWWSKITRLFNAGSIYNQALDIVAAERSNLRTWDWPSVQQSTGIALADDYTHLRDTNAYRQRSSLMSADITAQLAVATHSGTDAPLPVASGPASEYLPITPDRVLDTRTTSSRLTAGTTREVDLSSYVPAGTRAVAVNLTSVDPADDGFLTGYACDTTRAEVSSANYTEGTARGALAVLPISADGRLCVFTSAAADLVVDVQGAFVDDASRFDPVAPTRLLDTRTTGRAQMSSVAAPDGAEAVALNLTVTGSDVAGFLTAFPCGGAIPTVSNVNFGVGETIAGAAYVPIGADGRVCLFTNTPDVDVVVDLTGSFSASGALAFTPATPTRVYDTRTGIGGWSPIHGGGQTTDMRVAPTDAAAVTGTLTMVTPGRDGYLTAFGCGAVPETSNVNATRGGVLANSISVVLAAEGRLCIRSFVPTHVVFDTTGWWSA
ncbi:MAG: SGNH/GDSL hydrolase family protein [Ilumatobacteraceae bacterium]